MTPQQSQPIPEPSTMHLRGAVDLASLKKPAQSASASDPNQDAGFVMDVDEQGFPQLVQLSAEVPVVVELHADFSPDSVQLAPVLNKVVQSYQGRLVLARVDVEANPQIAQAFQAQGVPTVVAVLKGQPVPLFQGAVPEQQIRQFLDELLKVAGENGVTGTAGEGTGTDAVEDSPEPLPPLHQAAFDAIEAGDYSAAAEAYRKALAENPADAEARTGLTQVELLLRLQGRGAEDIRTAAADDPQGLQAQLDVADLDISGGHVEDAFNRLLTFIARSTGEERETARARLVELFDIVGAAEERVTAARGRLTRVLF
ncbi:tetratricopeptide repeat protein [Arthrobacter roseus]|uniref:tetratricopeptide repeat protein n=1 Tax=Arthrobacter roseus TaxID=136274 RepID=UPI0019649A4A|nr:tetratricopeptide repeat protein [Arthrobacter roseus]MBM7849002.1 putative thioredoxin [Arthrobacter roseus]